MMDSDTQVFQQAVQLHQQGRLNEAKSAYQLVLNRQPRHAQASYLMGVVHAQLKDFVTAESWMRLSLEVEPNNPATLCNLGNVQRETLRFEDASQSYRRALEIAPDLPEVHHNLGIACREMGQLFDAIQCFQKAIQLRPDYTLAHCNLSQVHHEVHHDELAFHHAHIAVSQQPQFADAYIRLGDALHALKRISESMNAYRQALALSPARSDASLRLAQLHVAEGNYVVAHQLIKKALEQDKELLRKDTWWTQWMLTKSNLCDWSDWEELQRPLYDEQDAGVTINPFLSITQSNSPVVLKRVAERFVEEHYSSTRFEVSVRNDQNDGRICIGYFSADFRNHPITFLMAELFETHDAERFKIICFSYGPKDRLTERVSHAVEEFVDVWGWSEEEILNLARSKRLDIAVDLGGFTVHSKLGLFAQGLAPVQVSYLGYLGTLGGSFIDYLIADEVIVPACFQENYSEKIAYLPCYQVNDSQRKIAERSFSRAELGLPEVGFVFCCFNNTFKFNPSTFNLWMRILREASGSVLFLYAENEVVERNLREQAESQQVDATRLIFGKRISVPEYLARYRVADLFLDTFPYNAGTTASDALWAGLPVLTRAGNVFASRVAASLLTAVGLPELIAESEDAYVQRAVGLAQNPEELLHLKQKLAALLKTADLFNTPKFTRSLEALFTVMHERNLAGLKPDVISV